MRVLHLATHENSGAGKAAIRLHQGLIKQNIDSLVLVSQKFSDLSSVVKSKGIVSLYKKTQPQLVNSLLKKIVTNNNVFSVNFTPSLIHQEIGNIKPDIINLHWIGWEFVSIEDLKKFNVPIVWTLHDMWAFTGGCHYSQECDRYTKSCGACPQLHSNRNWDLSKWVWQRKAKAWKNLNLTIVTPSRWLAKCVGSSSLFRDLRVETIHHGLDETTYKSIDRMIAREILNLPQDKQLVLFGAVNATSDPRKGFHLLQSALQYLSQSEWQEKLEIVIFGASESINPPNLGFKCHYLGRLKDDISLALAYSAAEVMVVPSIQESFGQTASESLACGTPVVSFNTTGLKDIVEHQQNGYLAQSFEIEDLAEGIKWILADQERHYKITQAARNKVEQCFTLEIQAQKYSKLFKSILNN